MSKEAILQGVAHNIAHHAGSGLSYISPHLSIALRAEGLEATEIDLMTESPYPKNVVYVKPLSLSLSALRSKAEEILSKHEFSMQQLSKLVLYATPAPWDKEGYCLHTSFVVTTSNGKCYDSGWLNELGNT